MPASFDQSGLPADPLVEKAYGIIANDEAAVMSSQILAGESRAKDAETLAGHMMAFASRKEWTAEKLSAEFSPRVSDIVEGVRAVYDRLGGKPAASPDDAVKQSFLAVGILDLEYAMEKYGANGLDDMLISVPKEQTPGKVTIVQDSVGGLLQRAYDGYAGATAPLVGTTSEPLLEQRFDRALKALNGKLTAPKSAPKAKFGFSFG